MFDCGAHRKREEKTEDKNINKELEKHTHLKIGLNLFSFVSLM